MRIRLYTFYTDLLAEVNNVGPAQSEQAKRDQDLFNIVHIQHDIPFFPQEISTFNKFKHVYEQVSQSHPKLCFAFMTEKSCMVLNKGQYYKFNSLQHAQEEFYKIKADDIVMHLLNKYRL